MRALETHALKNACAQKHTKWSEWKKEWRWNGNFTIPEWNGISFRSGVVGMGMGMHSNSIRLEWEWECIPKIPGMDRYLPNLYFQC